MLLWEKEAAAARDGAALNEKDESSKRVPFGT